VQKRKTMGRKKLERKPLDRLYSQTMHMSVPSHILENFEMWDAKEYKDRWVIEMQEKEGLIPEELCEKGVTVLDGYCNSIEMLSHGFVCKRYGCGCIDGGTDSQEKKEVVITTFQRQETYGRRQKILKGIELLRRVQHAVTQLPDK
jgi:hypothetical protein